jgi:hypothetical protein
MNPTEEQTYREGIKSDLLDIKADQQEIKTMVRYTNGKVRKIIIALVLMGGIVLGNTLSFKEMAPILLHMLVG